MGSVGEEERVNNIRVHHVVEPGVCRRRTRDGEGNIVEFILGMARKEFVSA
jgi:hypothetical protein